MKIAENQIYKDFCCEGYDYEIVLVYPEFESVWGVCSNSQCPDYHIEDDPYRGVSNWSFFDFEEMVEEGRPRFSLAMANGES